MAEARARGAAGPMPRPPAEERLRRILAVVPWVAAADGPRMADVCERFGYRTETELQEDLNLLRGTTYSDTQAYAK